MKFASICVKDNIKFKSSNFRSHTVPLHLTSSFEFDNIQQGIDIFTKKEEGFVYSRYGNPTIEAAAEKISALETFGTDIEAKTILFSSGMSAIFTLFNAILQPGKAILTHGDIYGGTMDIINSHFKKFGTELVLCNLCDLTNVEHHLKNHGNIELIYFETPSNPTLSCIDIKGIADLSKKYNKTCAIDNTFASPYLQQPFRFGADFIIHSTTKYLNGHGNSTGGALVGKDISFMQDVVWKLMKNSGTNSNPFDAWLLLNGLKTLQVRMDKQCENATVIAEFLERHSNVVKVNYPGLFSHPQHNLAKQQMFKFGAMLSFEINVKKKSTQKFLNEINFCTLAPTLGDVDTLVLHPATMSHLNVEREIRQRYGISDDLIRLSVGIEDVNDILNDLANALN
ncbi:MAG: aminotransferase class I/II-fold pyridoxal phosphate-dependent enzyme [Saprospiraceae bacterium]|nr:aminotransferase class I/II-fold pyridoxal phosphate-dependent enzyme [Saprospiraceae bacterium]